jgi:hypothetical protein
MSSFTKRRAGKFGSPFFIKLIGGKISESTIPASLNCDACIMDSVAITLLRPTEGKPSIKYPPSKLRGRNSLMVILGYNELPEVPSNNNFYQI